MIELVLASQDVDTIRHELTGHPVERCAILFANQASVSDSSTKVLVREIEFPADVDYSRQGVLEAELKPEVVARVAKRARLEGLSLIFVHSHPGDEPPFFSAIDDDGERRLQGFLSIRHPEALNVAVVISKGGMRARRLGTVEEATVVSVGPQRKIWFDPINIKDNLPEMLDRQVRVFGSAAQRALRRLRVAIVGLGGTGSIVAQQLVHLGVRRFLLIDPDLIETTNLNRVVNSGPDDVGQTKTSVAARYINAIASDADIESVEGDIIRAQIARKLVSVDMIFGCTDSHGSRAVLQQIAYQYLVPCIDMGTTIAAKNGQVTHIYGRVQLLAPGLACLTCSGLLNPDEVRRDMMTAFERKSDPYFLGDREPAPAVISLNGTVSSLAITMLLATVCEVPVAARHILYNAMSSTLRSVRAEPDKNCYICSRQGALARGDSWPLNARLD